MNFWIDEKKIERPTERMDSPQRFDDNSTDIFSAFALLLDSYECCYPQHCNKTKMEKEEMEEKE